MNTEYRFQDTERILEAKASELKIKLCAQEWYVHSTLVYCQTQQVRSEEGVIDGYCTPCRVIDDVLRQDT